ncbi:transposase [Kangiella sp.]|uniref:transposase n=1 Tax=Kangiella sp. TaxID=1920245 RepID=UPI0019AB962D|nr:transposase [Kangiella sp.]MBD3654286.1 transposase [Kangiella sp.]
MERIQRRGFSSEFKYEAASLVLNQDYSFTEARRVLDVHDDTLRNWMKQLELELGGHTSSSQALSV